MRVLNYTPVIGSGGIESFLYNAMTGLIKNGHDVEVCAQYKKNISPFDELFQKSSIPVTYFNNNALGKLSYVINFIKYFSKKQDEILHIHCVNIRGFVYAFLAKMCGVKKVVFHLHNTMNRSRSVIDRNIDKFIYCLFKYFADIKISCSELAGKQFFSEADFFVVHNGINLERFRFNLIKRKDIRNKLGVNNCKVIGQVGRYDFQKNQEFSIKLIKLLPSDYKLILIGDGVDYDMLQGLVVKNNIEDKVIFIAPHDNIEDYYQAFDMLIFPSRYEGLGIVSLEAQCAGLPVLCSEHIVDEVFITDHIYRLFLDDINSWIKYVLYLSDMSLNRYIESDKGIMLCSKSGYSIENMVNELIKIYNRKV